MSKATDAPQPRLMVWMNPATGDRYTILPDRGGSWDVYKQDFDHWWWTDCEDEGSIEAATYADACEAFGNYAAERGWTLDEHQ